MEQEVPMTTTTFHDVHWSASRKERRSKTSEMVMYSLHQAFFLWPLIVAGFVGAALVQARPDLAGQWGWAYVWVLLWTAVTLIFNVNVPRTLLWTMAFGFLWVLSEYLETLRHVVLLSWVVEQLRQLNPLLQPGFVVVISWLLLGPWLIGLLYTIVRGRKIFSPNVIEERILGEGSELTDRSGLTFRSRYPDLFESLAGFGCGDVEAVDGHGNVVRTWSDLTLLFFRWRRLNRILHERAVVETGQGNRSTAHSS